VSLDDDLFRAIFGEPGEERSVVDVLGAARRALRELQSTRAALDRLEAVLVQRARFAGTTWSEIAADLGVSRETARRRHAGHDTLSARPS
jgi:DNA-directed RNA polymerase specialized sigma24 family protein